MALWVDKHRPNNLDKLDYHADLSLHLKKLVRKDRVAKLHGWDAISRSMGSRNKKSHPNTQFAVETLVCIRRLPTYASLRTTRRRQEDSSRGYPAGAVWPWFRKGKNKAQDKDI